MGGKTVKVDEKVIERIRELKISGKSIQAITDLLKADGVKIGRATVGKFTKGLTPPKTTKNEENHKMPSKTPSTPKTGKTAKTTDRGGRPPKPKKERKSEKVTINITIGELDLLTEKAGEFPISTWLRVEMKKAGII